MPVEKETLLQDLKSTYQEALDTLSQIDPSIVVFDESGWTVRDLIDHVAMWEDEKVKGLEAFITDDVYLTPNFSTDKLSEYNRQMRDARLQCSYEEVIEVWQSIRDRMIDVVENMTTHQFKSAMTPPWGGAETMCAAAVAQDAIRHQNEHMEQILAACSVDT